MIVHCTIWTICHKKCGSLAGLKQHVRTHPGNSTSQKQYGFGKVKFTGGLNECTHVCGRNEIDNDSLEECCLCSKLLPIPPNIVFPLPANNLHF